MMLAAREVALRVNGMRVTDAKMRLAKNGPQIIMRAPLAFDVAVDDNSTLELLELSHPPEIRPKLPNRGWRKVSLRNLIGSEGRQHLAIAQIVADTRFPPWKFARFLAAKIAAAISRTRFRP